MNATNLLAHYERIADTQDAIPRLRRFILDLAVRGKLVPQNPSDEPISELLRRIAAYKEQIGSRRPGRETEIIQTLAGDDTPYGLPSGWVWVAFGDIVASRDGERVPVSREERNRRAKVFDYYGASGVIDKIDGYLFDKPLLLIGEDGANLINRSTPIAFIARGKYWVNNHAHVLDGPSEEFLRYLEVFINAIDLKPYVTGTAQPKMNQGKMNSIPVALPPIAEQRRIVVKVDELMALFDRLEATRAEREATRDRLTAASLARLNAPDPETFLDDGRFALDALPALTARTDQIKQLRQTILSLAVRGKLVRQDPGDEPASELLKRIGAEKARLIAAGKIKREKALMSIEDNTPFDIPRSWEWVQLDQLCRLITKGSSPKWQGVNYVNEGEGLLFITSENVGNYKLRKLDDLKYVESRFRDIEPRSMLQRSDLLLNLVGASIGRAALFDLDVAANINQAVALLRLVEIPGEPLSEFLLHYLNSPVAIQLMLSSRVITAQPNISLTDAREFPVPLPPAAEQYRIVAKVDELMAVCDRLEANLATGDETRRRLLTVLLAEALAPDDARELEAAE